MSDVRRRIASPYQAITYESAIENRGKTKIKRERMIGLTDAIEAALATVEDFSGLKPSQYCRQAILEKLVRDGYMIHPAAAHFKNINTQTVPAE